MRFKVHRLSPVSPRRCCDGTGWSKLDLDLDLYLCMARVSKMSFPLPDTSTLLNVFGDRARCVWVDSNQIIGNV